MAKKTKKTAPRSTDDAVEEWPDDPSERLSLAVRRLEEGQRERAVRRATTWAGLLADLERMLDRADGLAIFGVPLDFKTVEKHAKKLLAEGFPGSIGDARADIELAELGGLHHSLGLASNWVAILEPGRVSNPRALADVQARLEGKAPLDPTATGGEVLAQSIHAVRALLEADLALARATESVPSEEDLDLLRRIRDQPKTAKQLAVEIAGGKLHSADEKKVERAIQRLRAMGFELPNTRGVGYRLSSGDRARLDRITGGT